MTEFERYLLCVIVGLSIAVLCVLCTDVCVNCVSVVCVNCFFCVLCVLCVSIECQSVHYAMLTVYAVCDNC